ncbi:putative transposase/invertase (TIGR01784 family) [Bacillus ectoiniformans]|uniref:Rpn family recombination-promoting nuclease/putative transposase n=1 Tax=Bacillus ectoiniformans TaxID=1494429 RepID=UPI001EF98543|nr:Rpn family recombination-promoting nuclease/putative transposase [Bacillus ectoiniformans]MBM7649383.1 putative transposase/invertase (TIGR01784 family) [Bacillus ectoiniformans]
MKTRLLKRVPLTRLMDLKIDYAFKQLFGAEKNKEITVVFLNAVLHRTGRKSIKDITFSNTDAGGEYQEDKQSRLDLLATTNDHEQINIEIQFTNKYDMIKRSIYYWSGIYRAPMKKRMAYKQLQPVIAINILNFNLIDQTERFHTSFHLYEDTEHFKLTDVMEFHFLEMPKLLRDWKQNKLDPWNDILARWLLLLGMVDHRNGEVYEDIYKELEEIAMKDEKLKNAFQGWDLLSATHEEVLAYEARVKQVLDEEAARIEAELREKEAREEGREEGREEEKRSVIKRMLKQGLEVEQIALIVEVSKEDVEKIKNEQ